VSKLLIAPLEALTDKRLTESERKVLLVLFSFRGKVSDTVWPGREKIAERSNIKDLARIGKITTKLAELGWLVKYKKGFSGHNTYRLTFPTALEAEYTSNDDLPLEAESTSSLEVKTTSSMEAESTSCNKQTSITNQNNKPVFVQIGKCINLTAMFSVFWEAYPRKQSREDAKKAFLSEKIDLATLKIILQNINDRTVSGEYSQKRKSYIPLPATYLRGKRWEDEVIYKTLEAFNDASKQRDGDSIRSRDIVDALTDRSWAGV
jgi:hypothetical protein